MLEFRLIPRNSVPLHFNPGGGDSHVKVTGMLVVSLRVVNCRFWSRLGFLGRKANIFTHQVSLRVCVKKYLYEKNKRRQSLVSIFSAFKSLKLLFGCLF